MNDNLVDIQSASRNLINGQQQQQQPKKKKQKKTKKKKKRVEEKKTVESVAMYIEKIKREKSQFDVAQP